MITQYKNIDQIQTAAKSVIATRLEKSKTDLLSYSADERISRVFELTRPTNSSRTELHVYSGDSWITGNHKVQLQTKIPTSLPKRLSPVSTFTTTFGKNVKAKITKLQQQAYNLANIKQAKTYSKVSKKLGIEKSYKGPTADEIDILRSNVNTDARINVMDSEKISSADFIETAYKYEKPTSSASQYASVSYKVKDIRKGKPTTNFITRNIKVGEEDLKFGFEKKGLKKPMIVKQSQFKKPTNVPIYSFHKVNKPNINFNKPSMGQTTSGKTVFGKKLGDVSNKFNRTRNFKRSFSKFKITPKE